jgi:hypothetical protein
MSFDVTSRIAAIGQGGANYGWRIVDVSGYSGLRKFNSSEYTDASLRPRLRISYVAPSGPPNARPTVSLTSPAAGTSYPIGTPVGLAADADDSDGSVAKVEFFANGQKVGEALALPYTLSWTPPGAGDYSLTARATDDLGLSGDSTSVAITVLPASGSAVTTTLQQDLNGYTGMTDTMLSSYAKSSNFGTTAVLSELGQYYTNLFRFAVFASEGGPIPDGAEIVSATLEIYKSYYNYVYRLHPMLRSWDEAKATWSVASTGSAWAVAGAQGVGTDYAAAADAQYSAPWDPGWMSFDVTSRIAAIGQGGANYGWRIVDVSGYNGLRKFNSGEYNDTTLRPRLTVSYRAP